MGIFERILPVWTPYLGVAGNSLAIMGFSFIVLLLLLRHAHSVSSVVKSMFGDLVGNT